MDSAREQFIKKLENAAGLFQELFEKDPHGMIIGYEERERLKDLKRRNENVLNKLKSREFSVAVVGLEKAGKSTLGNALIRSIVLPEYPERCTYTTTDSRGRQRRGGNFFLQPRRIWRQFPENAQRPRLHR